MQINHRRLIATTSLSILVVLSGAVSLLRADQGVCNGTAVNLPFTDVAGNGFFCTIAEAYFSGLTSGTSATTYSPSNNVTRDQMAAFITRTMDQSLKRGSRRAALNRWYAVPPNYASTNFNLGTTIVGTGPQAVAFDGTDLWVANSSDNTVSRVRASDGRAVQTYTGVPTPYHILVALGKIFVTGGSDKLYLIDPASPVNFSAVQVATLGGIPSDLAFDGRRIWTVSAATSTISIVTPDAAAPWPVTNTPGGPNPLALVFDGANMWFGNDEQGGILHKLDSNGFVIANTHLGFLPSRAVFDGTNIWVACALCKTVAVVRAATGAVLATQSLSYFTDEIAFDGERVLVTHLAGKKISLWQATSLTYLGSYDIGAAPGGACSDGANFWITLEDQARLARF